MKKWHKLKQSQVKFNKDAAIKTTSFCSSFGGLVRDVEGEVLATFCSTNPSTLLPTLAEAMAFSQTMLLSKVFGFTNVVFWRGLFAGGARRYKSLNCL